MYGIARVVRGWPLTGAQAPSTAERAARRRGRFPSTTRTTGPHALPTGRHESSIPRYESYVDLEPGAWTPIPIVVDGVKARLYVHGASQPALIVNDLKMGDTSGGIALWIGPGTEAYFADVTITRRAEKD